MPGRTFIPCILLLALAASVRCGEPESLRAKACALMLAGHESEAVEAYRAAAEQGDTNAEIALGYAWLDGEGVPADPETARHWFARAAEKGSARGQYALGYLFDRTGEYELARRYYRLAAEQGHIPALCNLGVLLENGDGGPADIPEAVRLYQAAVDQGDELAALNLARLYDSGAEGFERDSAAAAHYYRISARRNHPDGQYAFGNACCHGDGVEQDYAEARRWFRYAAAAGRPEAMLALGILYRDGKGVDQDYAAARRWFREAGEAGEGAGFTSLGILDYNGTDREADFTAAARNFRRGAELGDPRAMLYLAECCRDGDGVERDCAKAVEWFLRAGDEKEADAYQSLGRLYFDGDGVERDCEAALRCFERGAELGDAASMTMAGYIHDNACGVERNRKLGFEWYSRGAEAGDSTAIFNLGIMYENGEYVEKNLAEALRRYRQSARKKNIHALCRLGQLYLNGSGVPADPRLALRCFSEAAALGSGEAAYELYRLCGEEGAFSAGPRLARRWLVRAADAENPAAQLELGRQLKEEKSPEAESRFAAVWNHEGAAAPLLSAACLELAGGYLAAGDIEKAGRLIEEAAARVPPETLYELYRVFRRKYPETARHSKRPPPGSISRPSGNSNGCGNSRLPRRIARAGLRLTDPCYSGPIRRKADDLQLSAGVFQSGDLAFKPAEPDEDRPDHVGVVVRRGRLCRRFRRLPLLRRLDRFRQGGQLRLKFSDLRGEFGEFSRIDGRNRTGGLRLRKPLHDQKRHVRGQQNQRKNEQHAADLPAPGRCGKHNRLPAVEPIPAGGALIILAALRLVDLEMLPAVRTLDLQNIHLSPPRQNGSSLQIRPLFRAETDTHTAVVPDQQRAFDQHAVRGEQFDLLRIAHPGQAFAQLSGPVQHAGRVEEAPDRQTACSNPLCQLPGRRPLFDDVAEAVRNSAFLQKFLRLAAGRTFRVTDKQITHRVFPSLSGSSCT